MLGIGYVIDWVSEATMFQIFKGYVVGGLAENFFMKIIISAVAGVIVSLVLPMKRKSSNKK